MTKVILWSASAEAGTGRPPPPLSEGTSLNRQQPTRLLSLYNVKKKLSLAVIQNQKKEAWRREKKEEETEMATGTCKWRREQRVWEEDKSDSPERASEVGPAKHKDRNKEHALAKIFDKMVFKNSGHQFHKQYAAQTKAKPG